MNPKSLGIVQSHPTQFDGPLYRLMSQQQDIDLTVYYYNHQEGTAPYDVEINRQAEWDHDIQGYKAVCAGAGIPGMLQFVRNILLARHELLIISGYMHAATLLPLLAGKLYGNAVGLRSDNILREFNAKGLKGSIKRAVFPLFFRLYATGHPVGSLAGEYLVRFGFRPEQLFLFPYAVDNDYLRERCNAYRQDRAGIRNRMGIGEKDLVVLGIMKFSDREDPITLLKGYSRAASRIAGLHLILVGDGPLRGAVNDHVRESNLSNVHLPGYRPYSELPMFYGISDIFVHTARRGCWEVSVQEALASDVPVIVSDSVGAGYDLVQDKGTGLFFKTGDEESLAEALVIMLLDHGLRKHCISLAQRVVQAWSYERTLEQLRAALEWIK